MFDKDKTHTGKTEIKHWLEQGNEKYKTVMNPL